MSSEGGRDGGNTKMQTVGELKGVVFMESGRSLSWPRQAISSIDLEVQALGTSCTGIVGPINTSHNHLS